MVQNIARALEACAARGEKTALVYYGRKFSYEELGKYARVCAQAFMQLGVTKGDRVALMMTNVPQFVFAYYGALLAGAVVTPINLLSLPRGWRADEKAVKVPEDIHAQIQDAKPACIVAFDFFFPLVRELISAAEDNCRVALTGPHEFLPALLKTLYPVKARHEGRWIEISQRPSWLFSFSELMRLEEKKISAFSEFPGMTADAEDVAQLQYTGGTTGTPKGVMLSHRNLLANTEQANARLGEFLRYGEEVVLGVLPFFHIYGLTGAMHMTLLAQHGTLVLVADSQNVRQWVKWTKEYGVTVIPSVPRIYEHLAAHHRNLLDRETFSSVRLFLNGAGVLPPQTRRIFEEVSGGRILEAYGLSEASPAVSVSTPKEWKEGSIGRPLPETQVRIVDIQNGEDLREGDEGEIVVKGPQVMQGYWQKAEETAEVLREGWLYTGDIGYCDEEGFLYITDRLKDMVKIAGENVFPAKIEKVLERHPEVVEVAVVGVRDAQEGERIVAVVVPRTQNANKAELAKSVVGFASETLALFEVPRDIRIVESLDVYKNPLGKVLKRRLREAIANEML